MLRLKSLRGLLPYLARYRGPLAWGIVCLVLTNAVALAAPWVLKKVIDGLRVSVTGDKLGRYALWIVGIAIVGGVFRYLMRSIIIGVSRALGETAPLITIGALTFIAFLPTPPVSTEPPFISFQWLWDGFTVLPIQAFNGISRPGSDFHANAAAACLVLLLLTLGLNAVAIYLR